MVTTTHPISVQYCSVQYFNVLFPINYLSNVSGEGFDTQGKCGSRILKSILVAEQALFVRKIHLFKRSSFRARKLLNCVKMTLQFSFIVSMFLLCGFLVVIPPASSIRCYRQRCVDNECYGGDEGVQCEGSDYDRCGMLSFGSKNHEGHTFALLQLNCARSTVDCSQNEVCENERKLTESVNEKLSGCSMTCCTGDMCNRRPGKDKDVKSP
ncbi:hypothetical protein OS493_014956 [Desmophyllum pertusum]|uniref:Uncharacterized protein n=1 Tax=Desmophyllum pertusum TaxID=174260 RepID=A0A9X0A2U5_9CNID|nr:hypothetical protein OS493_014956 [Desmophyllum pertusum]